LASTRNLVSASTATINLAKSGARALVTLPNSSSMAVRRAAINSHLRRSLAVSLSYGMPNSSAASLRASSISSAGGAVVGFFGFLGLGIAVVLLGCGRACGVLGPAGACDAEARAFLRRGVDLGGEHGLHGSPGYAFGAEQLIRVA